MRSLRTCAFVVVVSLLSVADANVGSAAGRAAAGPREAFGRLPLAFEENRGQAEASAKFIARAPGYTVLLGEADAVVRLPGGAAAFRMSLAGGARAPRVSTTDRQVAVSHYLIGNDPAKWRSDVPRYGRVRYAQVYDGIDLVYYGNHRQLEHDFVVAPGADPAKIVLQYSGVDAAAVENNGDLVLRVNDEAIRFHKPVAYQDAGGGRRQVTARFELDAAHRVRFALGDYDATRELVIDPVLSYSSYGGGGGSD